MSGRRMLKCVVLIVFAFPFILWGTWSRWRLHSQHIAFQTIVRDVFNQVTIEFNNSTAAVPDSLRRADFTTSIPLVYLNLQRSLKRRHSVEKLFGSCGKLYRVSAIDSHELLPTVPAYKATVGELALFYTHVKALQFVAASGFEHALVMEDDMSLALLPYWRLPLNSLVKELGSEDPDWDVLRLQYGFAGGDLWTTYKKWRDNPSQLFEFSGNRFMSGTGAYLVSIRGAKKVVQRYTTHSSVDCLQGNEGYPCIADKLLYRNLRTYIVTPPMIIPHLNMWSTGVRGGKPGGLERRWMEHHETIANALHWAVEAYEYGQDSDSAITLTPASRWVVKVDENSCWFLLHRLFLQVLGVCL